MKTVFVINPKAGKKTNCDELINNIKENAQKYKCDVEIYMTKSVGDATDFVKNYCEKNGAARFIACGGDGTLNEVTSGAIGFEGVEIGVIPKGTGNDFCRNFENREKFGDILCQIHGNTVKCDAIKYETEIDGKIKTGYCVNMFNIGFDCNVADKTDDLKAKTFLSGSLAYFAAIFVTLIKKKCSDLKIELDGTEKHNGKLLLTSLANGCFCGGGIKSNPLAEINDGLININIIKNVSRLKFISLLPYYMKGTVFGVKNIGRYISTDKCKSVTVTPYGNGKIRLCVDGEIIDAGKTRFEIVHDAFDFVVPCELSEINTKDEVTV